LPDSHRPRRGEIEQDTFPGKLGTVLLIAKVKGKPQPPVCAMTSLTQYPASEVASEDILQKNTLHADLGMLSLFLDLQAVTRRARHGTSDDLCLVPTILPTVPQNTSLGVAADLEKELMNGQGEFTSEGILRQSFLVASRNGYARFENEEPAEGYPRDIMDLISGNADATLRHQMCNMFDYNTQSLTNLKSRPATAQDLELLDELITKELDNRSLPAIEGGIEECCTSIKLAEVLLKMERLRNDDEGKYEGIFHALAKDKHALSSFQSSSLGRKIFHDMRTEEDQELREEYYYLAVTGIMCNICPVFLSPVGSCHEILATIMLSSGLIPHTKGVRVPQMKLRKDSCTEKPVGRKEASAEQNKLVVTLFHPSESTQGGLSRAVRHLAQQSICMARSIGTKSAAMVPMQG